MNSKGAVAQITPVCFEPTPRFANPSKGGDLGQKHDFLSSFPSTEGVADLSAVALAKAVLLGRLPVSRGNGVPRLQQGEKTDTSFFNML